MQRKTIKKIIEKKLSAWINTIDDDLVKSAVLSDTILTGGAIASMLSGERVNDFDVYFRTKETADKVARYYVAKFKETHPQYRDMTVRLEEKTNIKNETEERVCIIIPSRGIAGENPDAEDVEVMQSGDLEPVEKVEDKTYRPIFFSENAITLTDSIQIIVRFCGDPETIHNNFDFAHAMSWYSLKDGVLFLDPLAMECILSKTLIYRGSLYPMCSIFRVRKFIQRGWKISAGELLKIMWQISEIDLTDKTVLREQLTGVDATYFSMLIDSLQDVEKDKLHSSYVAEIIDRIFQGE